MSQEFTIKAGYPIVSAHSLQRPERRGPLGVLGRKRESHELPRPEGGHHVLVYRVNGEFVVDQVSLGPRNELVVNASHVSVVDVRQNAPITVRFSIPSRDAKEFTVVVTFWCTVTDPITVVREGLIDPDQMLATYVKSYHNAMQMGLDHTIDEVNDVRRAVDIELKAYAAVSPPRIEGLKVGLRSVEVETPQQVAEFESEMWNLRRDHNLDVTRIGYKSRREEADHAFQRLAHQNGFERDLDQLDHTQLVERKTIVQKEEVADASQTARIRREKQLNAHQRDEFEKTYGLYESDPRAAYVAAQVAGVVDHRELADKLSADQERIALEADRRDQAAAEREDRLRAERNRDEREERRERRADEAKLRQEKEQHDRERHAERLTELREDRVDARATARHGEKMAELELEAQREKESQQFAAQQAEAIIKHRETQYQLDADRRMSEEERNRSHEAAKRQLQAKIEIIREIASRGALDTVDVDQLINQITGGPNLSLEAGSDSVSDPGDDKPAPESGSESGTPATEPVTDDSEPSNGR